MKFGSKSCEQVRSYLDSYVTGEPLVETDHKMRKHLETCRSCSAELEARERMKNLLKRAVHSETAPAALVLVICLASWGAISMWNGERNFAATLKADFNPALSEQAMRVLSIGLSDHILCAIDNSFRVKYFGFYFRDLEEEDAGLVPAVRERLGNDFEVAAHRCHVGDRSFTHIVLRNGKMTLSVIITRAGGEAFPLNHRIASTETSGASLYHGRTQDYAVAGFEVGEHLAFVISNLDSEENLRITSNIVPGVRHFLMRSESIARF